MTAPQRVILWDIDGTLVHTAGVGASAFITAIETLFGVPAGGHGVSLAGKTDPQIAREILTVLDLHDDAGTHLPGLLAETERLVAAGRDEIRARGRVLPGVPALLEHRAEYEIIERGPARIGLRDRVFVEFRRHRLYRPLRLLVAFTQREACGNRRSPLG